MNKTFKDQLVNRICNDLKENFDLSSTELPEEYNYSSLPLCLIDAIFSIGVRYTTTKKTVMRYCENAGIEHPYRNSEDPSADDRHTISDLLSIVSELSIEAFANIFLQNKQRTSSKNGILKAEAVCACAKILRDNQIETIADFRKNLTPEVEREFRKIKGQGSGISLTYLKMLCGDNNLLKPDRHIINYISLFADGESFDAQDIIKCVIDKLNRENQGITVRLIDYKIWAYMSGSKADDDFADIAKCANNIKKLLNGTPSKDLDRILEICKRHSK